MLLLHCKGCTNPVTVTSPSLLLAHQPPKGKQSCDVNGEETEHAICAGELGTEVRYGESRQLMGRAPSQVPRAVSTAQLCFGFPTLVFHAHLLEQNWFRSETSLCRYANTILEHKFNDPRGFVLFFLLTNPNLSTSVTCIRALLFGYVIHP